MGVLFIRILLSIFVIYNFMHSICCQSNVDQLLRDKNNVRKQINCVLANGPCDAIGNSIKQLIPEVLGRNCKQCNPTQAANSRKIINHVKVNYPDAWNKIVAKYNV